MNDQAPSVLLFALALLLPLSSLLARRIPMGQLARMALAWVGIFAVGLVLVTAYTRNRRTIDEWLVSAGLKGAAVRGGTVTIARAEDGHFYADVEVNGVASRLMIDSGATETALSPDLANAAGIKPNARDYELVDTAGGEVKALIGAAERVRLGPITADRLGVLIAPSFKDGVLGMNFLSQLKSWRVEGDMMVLTAAGAPAADDAN